MNKNTKITLLVVILFISCLLGTLLYTLIDEDTTKTDNKMVLYSYDSAGRPVGGYCTYPLLDQDGKRTNICIDEAGMEALQKNHPNPYDMTKDTSNGSTLSDLGSRDEYLLKIEADTHLVSEKRSNTANPPTTEEVDVLYIDKIYSVEYIVQSN